VRQSCPPPCDPNTLERFFLHWVAAHLTLLRASSPSPKQRVVRQLRRPGVGRAARGGGEGIVVSMGGGLMRATTARVRVRISGC
jgi:hypothetical protein